MHTCQHMATTPPKKKYETPFNAWLVEHLLRLRWAEALLSAHEAEVLVMDYVNGQCQVISKDARDGR